MGLIRKVGGMMLAHALLAGAAIAQVPGVVAGGVPGDMAVHQRRATQYLACSQLAAAPWPKQSVARRAFLQRLETARAECLDHAEFLAGRQTPMFFGSAINNFGVREVLDALCELAPPPGARAALERTVEPAEPKFSGVVFKVQANMDPAHRDRIAFVRVSFGSDRKSVV